MKQVSGKITKQDRDELRRAEIIAAARKCVAYKGFHATSMNEVAKTARMSVGHIYRYFDNKEDIIKAIVEKIAQEHLDWIASTAHDKDIADFHITRITEKFLRDSEERAILLEISAEAARNPEIAAVIEAADKQFRDKAVATVRLLHPDLDDADLYARVELMATLTEGFLSRSIKKPVAQTAKVYELLGKMVSQLWAS